MNRFLLIFLCVIGFTSQAIAQLPTVRINELVASNGTGIRDSNGDRSDWIEIHNDGLTAINLAGYFLTDSKETPLKWIFPSFSIPAKSYRIVFASSKNTVIGSEVHTNFEGAAGLTTISGELVGATPDKPCAISTLREYVSAMFQLLSKNSMSPRLGTNPHLTPKLPPVPLMSKTIWTTMPLPAVKTLFPCASMISALTVLAGCSPATMSWGRTM
jgi:hypothetical protein